MNSCEIRGQCFRPAPSRWLTHEERRGEKVFNEPEFDTAIRVAQHTKNHD